jgi:hypothetical protein
VLRLRGLKELTEAFPSSAPQANVPGMDATLPPARQQEFEVPEADGELHIPALGPQHDVGPEAEATKGPVRGHPGFPHRDDLSLPPAASTAEIAHLRVAAPLLLLDEPPQPTQARVELRSGLARYRKSFDRLAGAGEKGNFVHRLRGCSELGPQNLPSRLEVRIVNQVRGA